MSDVTKCEGRRRGAAVACAALLLLPAAAPAAPAPRPAEHRCAAAAGAQARALLSFHAGRSSTDVDIDDGVRLLAPIRNPANRRQIFDVLEVQGHVYKADYRLRLIYARVPGNCLLMGQEVIEESSL